MATWAFYSDAAMTAQLTVLSCEQTTNTFHVYFGSTSTGYKLINQTTGANITVACVDSATGGHAVTAIKQAATTGGLAASTGGAAYSLGTQVLGGVANKEDWFISVTDSVGDGVLSTELSLALGSLYEQAV